MKSNDFIGSTWPFLLLAFLYVFIGLSLNKFYGEDELHLLLNSYHAPWADVFFKYYTKTGEFLFGLMVIALLIKKLQYKDLMILITSIILQTVIVRGMKRLLYINHLRPGFYFEEKGIALHLVEGVKQGITFTYPSGHSATVFMLFLFLTLLTPNRWLQALLAFAAILGAYSRIYLSQHFMQDTIGGGLIGIFVVVVSYYFINAQKHLWLNRYIIKRKL